MQCFGLWLSQSHLHPWSCWEICPDFEPAFSLALFQNCSSGRAVRLQIMGAPSSGLLGENMQTGKCRTLWVFLLFSFSKTIAHRLQFQTWNFYGPNMRQAVRCLFQISVGIAAHVRSPFIWRDMGVCLCCVLLFESWQSVVICIGGRREDASECVVMAGITISLLYTGFLLWVVWGPLQASLNLLLTSCQHS